MNRLPMPSGRGRSSDSERARSIGDPRGGIPQAAKIIISGGFGVGKTTLVSAISEIEPVTTEAMLTSAGANVDQLVAGAGKTTTTVAMDFGRITLAEDLVLYLFATPGQSRFWFMWDEISRGAVGSIIMADVRRLGDCFAAVDFFESRKLPIAIAVNQFPDSAWYAPDAIRAALTLPPQVPVYMCDARDRESVKSVLIGLTEHALSSRVRRADRIARMQPAYQRQ